MCKYAVICKYAKKGVIGGYWTGMGETGNQICLVKTWQYREGKWLGFFRYIMALLMEHAENICGSFFSRQFSVEWCERTVFCR